jgi:hypothetical protein
VDSSFTLAAFPRAGVSRPLLMSREPIQARIGFPGERLKELA